PEAVPENGGRRKLALAERDRLRSLPERQAAELRELLATLDDRGEVVPGERARLGGEGAVAVRKEELGLRDAAGIEEELAGGRVAGRVLGADPELALAPGDPVRLAAPAAVDDPVLEGQNRSEGGDRGGCVLFEETRPEGEAGGDDLEHPPGTLAMRQPAREQIALVLRHVSRVRRRHQVVVDRRRLDQRREQLDLRPRGEDDAGWRRRDARHRRLQ